MRVSRDKSKIFLDMQLGGNTPRLPSCSARLDDVAGDLLHSRRMAIARPDIPWRRVIGLRNRLIHEYDRVDLDILWLIVRDDVPVLLSELARILPPE